MPQYVAYAKLITSTNHRRSDGTPLALAIWLQQFMAIINIIKTKVIDFTFVDPI